MTMKFRTPAICALAASPLYRDGNDGIVDRCTALAPRSPHDLPISRRGQSLPGSIPG
ncbi:hypothetical protein Q4511_08200 [Paracoccus sp. 1_MG-2023]|uniref:hypothetical protein n=1 Tax=unclassified Paracoccus (in: a-proteobacteria) TaxID=2688777 RepID=UPI001C08E038|nr:MULTISPECIES: hypothetical protein [unclassified Paracoccus (in: a-proteobacteria)]MBU2957904.1 hypothetical protein [Paracoccus sp. C2R09]MDO6668903.1 hypothetical protein [Paracoccus sp. 1_MG-2023]